MLTSQNFERKSIGSLFSFSFFGCVPLSTSKDSPKVAIYCHKKYRKGEMQEEKPERLGRRDRQRQSVKEKPKYMYMSENPSLLSFVFFLVLPLPLLLLSLLLSHALELGCSSACCFALLVIHRGHLASAEVLIYLVLPHPSTARPMANQGWVGAERNGPRLGTRQLTYMVPNSVMYLFNMGRGMVHSVRGPYRVKSF